MEIEMNAIGTLAKDFWVRMIYPDRNLMAILQWDCSIPNIFFLWHSDNPWGGPFGWV